MEDERDQEEFKHVCRLCNKRFPSGKSLGGHMRSHVIAEARKNKLAIASLNKVPTFGTNVVVPEKDEDVDDDEDDDDIEHIGNNINNNNNSGYGLRENPKKTWRMVDSYPDKHHHHNSSQINNNNNTNNNYNNNSNNNIINGNNNQQERVCKQCGKGFHSLKALCGHMSIHSDKDRHFKDEDEDNSWSSDSIDQLYLAMESHSENNSKRQTRSSYFSSGGGSSSNYSEIDQLEQEEVAMCLMMLSRDSSGSKNWFSFGAAESSDNNSVILEGGLSKSKGKVKFVKGKIDVVDNEMDNSDSGYFENGAKVLESDDSVDGFSNKRKMVHHTGENYYGSKITKHDYFISNNNKYECWICSKTFKTHQALGGHIISHRKNGENNINNNNGSNLIKVNNNGKNLPKKGSASKKVKGHKCPYCPKVFKSGQALGGHKRSHMMGSNNVVLHSEGRLSHVRNSTPPSSPSKIEPKPPLIDLNLPAPLEEEGSGNSQFVGW
ncbi:hypothetical protein RND81_11G046500 [Saponaria officinalis]|uniref:C2H2-type domain-containing protein n=1 Tax=Saponaria officinalis TaxID=3572 RepID=A0AAW1HJL7_SAPOF